MKFYLVVSVAVLLLSGCSLNQKSDTFDGNLPEGLNQTIQIDLPELKEYAKRRQEAIDASKRNSANSKISIEEEKSANQKSDFKVDNNKKNASPSSDKENIRDAILTILGVYSTGTRGK